MMTYPSMLVFIAHTAPHESCICRILDLGHTYLSCQQNTCQSLRQSPERGWERRQTSIINRTFWLAGPWIQYAEFFRKKRMPLCFAYHQTLEVVLSLVFFSKSWATTSAMEVAMDRTRSFLNMCSQSSDSRSWNYDLQMKRGGGLTHHICCCSHKHMRLFRNLYHNHHHHHLHSPCHSHLCKHKQQLDFGNRYIAFVATLAAPHSTVLSERDCNWRPILLIQTKSHLQTVLMICNIDDSLEQQNLPRVWISVLPVKPAARSIWAAGQPSSLFTWKL